MLSIAFAFCVATGLFLAFEKTRWIGIVGVFVLLAVNPYLFGVVLLGMGVLYWLLLQLKNRLGSNVARLPSEDSARKQRNTVLLLVTLGAGGLIAAQTVPPISPGFDLASLLPQARSTPSEEVIVLRTPGGLLEVSRIHATEIIDARITHTILGVNIGETVPRIRVPAVFRYHVELASEWTVHRNGDVFTVIVPPIRPSLPVAIDLGAIERDVAGTWVLLPFTSRAALSDLERTVTEKLAEKARSRDYLDRQRQEARETVREFARKWIIEQTRWPSSGIQEIRVMFADEPAVSIAALHPPRHQEDWSILRQLRVSLARTFRRATESAYSYNATFGR